MLIPRNSKYGNRAESLAIGLEYISIFRYRHVLAGTLILEFLLVGNHRRCGLGFVSIDLTRL